MEGGRRETSAAPRESRRPSVRRRERRRGDMVSERERERERKRRGKRERGEGGRAVVYERREIKGEGKR